MKRKLPVPLATLKRQAADHFGDEILDYDWSEIDSRAEHIQGSSTLGAPYNASFEFSVPIVGAPGGAWFCAVNREECRAFWKWVLPDQY